MKENRPRAPHWQFRQLHWRPPALAGPYVGVQTQILKGTDDDYRKRSSRTGRLRMENWSFSLLS
ncbi:MAG: hypothetical protein CM15mV3_2340 [Caudoviricetes sp.]|nr:MAG: hypothetical protein CM15mV3_2340 [Caudoviricetes sp.]